MSETFEMQSKDIAQNFIQTVLFVDDKAYLEDQGDHPFDVKQMIKESATRGLIATACAPEKQGDLNYIVAVGKKADVIVLDWRIDISEDTGQDLDDEEEECVTDIRGNFSINVIKKLIYENESVSTVDQLKLIFIYTGEPVLHEIFARLKTELREFKQLDDFTLSYDGIRISIWAKESLLSSFMHMEENKKRIRSYSGLIDEIPIEYTASSGLLKNTCLKAITLLRNNTYKLLARFSPNLDPAFIAHRAMLLRPEEAGELLKETICGEVNSILSDKNITNCISNQIICDWLKSKSFMPNEIKITDSKRINIDTAKRELWQTSGYVDFLSSVKDQSGRDILPKEIEEFGRLRIKKYACETFKPQDTPTNYSNEDFSILTHHKRNYHSIVPTPILSLGVVVKNEERYLLCIQQKCDSVRIPKRTFRKFLFLPMTLSCKNIDVILKIEPDNYVCLSVGYKECHNLEIVEFAPNGDSGVVAAQTTAKGLHFFTGKLDTQYQWILELKEPHAQRIANNFAAQLARVGLDESEWLRRT